MKCCCGEECDQLVPLLSHDEVKVCRMCIGWLRARAGIRRLDTILTVSDVAASVEFHERAGFVRRHGGGGYAFVSHDDERIFDLDVAGRDLDAASNQSGCQRLLGLGFPNRRPRGQAPWGMREFTLTDPSGNYLPIGRSIEG